jgi:hypothetical protein
VLRVPSRAVQERGQLGHALELLTHGRKPAGEQRRAE